MSIYLSVCLFVCLCVCVCVRYRLTFFLPSLPEVVCLIFFADFALQNMVEITHPDGLETSGQRLYRKFLLSLDVFDFLHFGYFFLFFKKNWFLGIVGPPYCGAVLLSALVERCFVSHMRDFSICHLPNSLARIL